MLCSCIHNAEHHYLSFPQDSFPCSCCFLNFFSSTPLFTPCLCLVSTTSAEKSPSKDKKANGKQQHSFTTPLFCTWKHAASDRTGQLASQQSLWYLTRMLCCSGNHSWLSFGMLSKQDGFFAGLYEGHTSRVAENTGYCYSKRGTEKKKSSGSPVCHNTSVTYETKSNPQLQSCKIMCTTAVIQDYNNYYARDINVILDSCWKQIWMFLLACKIKYIFLNLFIYNSILQEIDCPQQSGRALLTSCRDW